jgi:hypothetical protein
MDKVSLHSKSHPALYPIGTGFTVDTIDISHPYRPPRPVTRIASPYFYLLTWPFCMSVIQCRVQYSVELQFLLLPLHCLGNVTAAAKNELEGIREEAAGP